MQTITQTSTDRRLLVEPITGCTHHRFGNALDAYTATKVPLWAELRWQWWEKYGFPSQQEAKGPDYCPTCLGECEIKY